MPTTGRSRICRLGKDGSTAAMFVDGKIRDAALVVTDSLGQTNDEILTFLIKIICCTNLNEVLSLSFALILEK